MIHTSELIQLSLDYQNALPVVGFPLNMPINLNEVEQAREFISNLAKSAKGEEVQITNYDQLQQYMQAQTLLRMVISLPKAGSKKSIEAWQRDRFKLPEKEPVYINLFAEILETQKQWHEQSRYLNVPYEFYNEAGVIKFSEEVRKLPASKQKEKEQALKALNMLKDPQVLFNAAKVRATSDLQALVQMVQAKHKDKSTLIGHVFIDIAHDLSGHNNMSIALNQVNQWLRYGVNERYRITDNALDNMVKNITQGAEQATKVKDQKENAKAKQEEEESNKQIEQFKATAKELSETDPKNQERAKLEKDLNDTFRSALTWIEDTQRKEELAMRYYEALMSMQTEPRTVEYSQLAKYLEAARSSDEKSIRAAAEALVGFSKPI